MSLRPHHAVVHNYKAVPIHQCLNSQMKQDTYLGSLSIKHTLKFHRQLITKQDTTVSPAPIILNYMLYVCAISTIT